MATRISPLAGKPAPRVVARRRRPARRRVLHRRSRSGGRRRSASPSAPRAIAARRSSFVQRAHVLAISQAICSYREQQGIDGPLFLGIDTHALSQPAAASALEVLAAQRRRRHARRGRRVHADAGDLARDPHATTAAARRGLADGIVVTPSHNPPDDGGFKYNPPNGGPAGVEITPLDRAGGERPARAGGWRA